MDKEMEELEKKIFDQKEPVPIEPGVWEKADGLQKAFNKSQAKWLKTLALFTKHTIVSYKYSKTEIKSFIKDIKDTRERENEVLAFMEETAKDGRD